MFCVGELVVGITVLFKGIPGRQAGNSKAFPHFADLPQLGAGDDGSRFATTPTTRTIALLICRPRSDTCCIILPLLLCLYVKLDNGPEQKLPSLIAVILYN